MRRLSIAATLLIALVLTACAATPEPDPTSRPVTTAESQLLAVSRFNNFDAGSRPFTTSVRERGTDLALQGWIDYATHAGYAAVTGEFDPQALLWVDGTVGIHAAEPDSAGDPPLPLLALDDLAWQSHPLDATASRLDALLIALSNLGSDRPDNPLLVQQTGALWLREDEVDGTAVTVFAAPPSDEVPDASDPPITEDTAPLRLWIDDAGLMRRAEVMIGADWVTADFPNAPGERLELPEGDG